MRVAWLCALLLAGCATPAASPPAGDSCRADPCLPACHVVDCSGPARPIALPGAPATGPPDLSVGTAWTYSQKGTYDTAQEITVVVANKDASGYLFAAGTEAQLVSSAIWGADWYGHHKLNLAQDEAGRVGPGILEFPLFDGKSWDLHGRSMVARATNVTTPGGTSPGFVITGARNASVLTVEYAPSVGYVTRYHIDISGQPFWDLTLTKVDHNHAGWVWFKAGPRLEQGNHDLSLPVSPPAPVPLTPVASANSLDVPAGFDAVLVSAGSAGGRVELRGPDGAAWSFENGGAEKWTQSILPGTAGKWALAAASSGQDGWAYGVILAVNWVRG